MFETSVQGLDESTVEDTASMMLMLSHPGRLKLMLAMQAAPHSTRGQLAEDIQRTPHQVTHLLRSLRAADLVQRRKTGRSVHYCISDPTVSAVLETLRDQVFASDLADPAHALSA